jgi:hypothetical protein
MTRVLDNEIKRLIEGFGWKVLASAMKEIAPKVMISEFEMESTSICYERNSSESNDIRV